MRTRYRIAIVIVFAAAAAAGVAGLSALGSASEGPLSSALGWIGAITGSMSGAWVSTVTRARSPLVRSAASSASWAVLKWVNPILPASSGPMPSETM